MTDEEYIQMLRNMELTIEDSDDDAEPEDEEHLEPEWVCVDCIQAIANDDFDTLSDKEEARIRAAVYTGKGYWVCGDEEPDTFSRSSCDCCGSWLAGERHAAHYIENKESEV